MSTPEGPIVGGVRVRIEPDASGFKQSAEQQIDASIKGVKAKTDELFNDAIAKSAAFTAKLNQTKSIQKDVLEKLNTALAAQRNAEASGGVVLETFARSFYAEELPALKVRAAELEKQILIEAELAAMAKQRVREQIRAAVEPPAAQKKAGVTDFLKAGAGGRTTGIGGLIGGGLRLGVLGLAATTAFQAFSELQGMLKATGDDAFTTTGKLRNLGAELMGGNIIGGIKALTADKPAEFDEPLTAALKQFQEIKTLGESTSITLQELIDLQNRASTGAPTGLQSADRADRLRAKQFGVDMEGASDALKDFLQEQVRAGAISKETAKELLNVGVRAAQQAKFVKEADRALQDYERSLESAGSAAAKFGREGGRPDDTIRAGQGAVGAVTGQQRTGIPRPIVTNPFANPVFQAGTGGEQVANQIRASIAARTKDEEERLALDLKGAKIIQKQAKAAFDVKQEAAKAAGQADGAAAEWLKYVEATTGVVTAAQAAKAATEAAAIAGQELGNAVRDAQVASIVDPGLQSEAAIRAQRIVEGQAKARFDAAKKGSKEANEAYAAWQIERYKTIGMEAQAAQTARDAARQTAEQNAASNRAGREQGLENAITAAALTKRTSDDKIAFDAAIRYWVQLRNNAENIEEREAARAKILDLSQGRAAALKGGTAGDDNRLLKITNDILAARLTPGIADDKKRQKILVDYWRAKMKNAVDFEEKERARTNFLQARLGLQALQKNQGEESPDVFANRLFTMAADQQRRFGSNISSTAGGILAPQDARGAFADALLGTGTRDYQQQAQRTRDAQLVELRKSNAYLQAIAQPKLAKVPITKPPQETAADVRKIGADVLRGM